MKKSRKNKFLLVGTSSVLVASAFAPVAFAKSFSDVPANSSHVESVDYLSDRDIVSGYSDGTFKPNRQLSRSDVVKMMGKYLVEVEGKRIPSDYKTKMRFKDLRPNGQDELLRYAALVYDEGLFQGSNGNLMYQNPISRQNMAVVLSRLIAKKYEVADLGDLMDFAGEYGGTIEVTDLNAAFADYRDEIELLDLLAITNVQKFNPSGTVTRGQFASFLYRTLENNLINKYTVNMSVPLDRSTISADGRTISFKGVLAGTNIKVYNGSDTKLGEGTANQAGDLSIALNPALKASDTVKLQVTLPNGEIIWCEFPSDEWSLGGGLTPGDGTNPGEVVDVAAFKELIASATANKVAVSLDGKDILTTDKWTLQADLDAYEAKINSATTIANKAGVTSAEVTAAKVDLEAAMTAYNNNKKDGLKVPNLAEAIEALNTLVASANSAKTNVKTSPDGKDIPTTEQWTTQQQLDALTAKITAATNAMNKTGVTVEEITTANQELKEALVLYNSQKKPGLKEANLEQAKQSLTTLIAEANSGKANIKVSTDGKDILTTEQWTTQQQLDALAAKITAATTAMNKTGVTVAELTTANEALTAALALYNSQKKPGLKEANLEQEKQALMTLITAANSAKVKASTNGQDVLPTEQWTTQEALKAFETAIADAQQTANKPNVTVNEINSAKTALQTAINQYNAAKQAGKTADLQALKTLIGQATESIVPVSTNGAEIEVTKKWTTQEALTNYQTKISEATTVSNKTNVLDTEVAEAITMLKRAMDTYEAAKKLGQKADLSSLTGLIATAESAKVKTSTTNGSDIPINEKWTLPQVLTTFEAAITAAKQVNNNPQSTQVEVSQAQTTLANALNTYNGAKLNGTQEVLLAQRSVSNVALKTSETQFGVPIGGTALNSPALSFNVLQLQLGAQIGGDLLGTNQGTSFTVPTGSELSFSFRATLSAVLGLGSIDLGVYEKNSNGELTRVWLDKFEYLSAVGAPLQNKYNFTVEGLPAGDYVLLAGPTNGVALNLLGGMAIVFTESVLENKSSAINASLATKSVTGQTIFNNDASITSVTPNGKPTVSNVSAPIEGAYGRLLINAQDGTYTYTSYGDPNSVGKVDLFEYEITRGEQKTKGNIYIRHNAVDGSTTIPLKWDDTDYSSNAVMSALTAQIKTVVPSPGADVRATVPDRDLEITGNSIISNSFFVTGPESTVKFQPINTLGNTTFELYKVGNESVPVKAETESLATLLTPDIVWTGIPRGEYIIRATRSNNASVYGIQDIEVVNKPYTAADLNGQLFSQNATVNTSTTSYVAPGSLVYVDNTLVTDSTEIVGDYGTLTIKKDGSYKYKTTNQNSNFATNPPEVFDVEVHGSDGSVKKTTLTIRFGNSSAYVPSTFYSLSNAPTASTVDFKG